MCRVLDSATLTVLIPAKRTTAPWRTNSIRAGTTSAWARRKNWKNWLTKQGMMFHSDVSSRSCRLHTKAIRCLYCWCRQRVKKKTRFWLWSAVTLPSTTRCSRTPLVKLGIDASSSSTATDSGAAATHEILEDHSVATSHRSGFAEDAAMWWCIVSDCLSGTRQFIAAPF